MSRKSSQATATKWDGSVSQAISRKSHGLVSWHLASWAAATLPLVLTFLGLGFRCFLLAIQEFSIFLVWLFAIRPIIYNLSSKDLSLLGFLILRALRIGWDMTDFAALIARQLRGITLWSRCHWICSFTAISKVWRGMLSLCSQAHITPALLLPEQWVMRMLFILQLCGDLWPTSSNCWYSWFGQSLSSSPCFQWDQGHLEVLCSLYDIIYYTRFWQYSII
jgi:hypothetical protein